MTHGMIPLYALATNKTSQVYASGKWVDGEYMQLLEKQLQSYLDIPYVILTNSGTSALLAAYWVLRKDYNEVAVDPYTFPATYQPARLLGYETKYLRTTWRPNTPFESGKLHTITHLFGQPEQRVASVPVNIEFIEDACQSFGAEINGQKVGTFGRFGCFSFYPTKSLHACGHGGALVMRNLKDYEAAKVFIESGRKQGSMTDAVALNLRMDEIKAEFLIAELAEYDARIERQRDIAHHFKEQIPGDQPFLAETNNSRHIFSVFNMIVDNQEKFRNFMSSKNIQTAIYYDASILPERLRPEYKDITSHIVAVPCRYTLSDDEIIHIAAALKEWYS